MWKNEHDPIRPWKAMKMSGLARCYHIPRRFVGVGKAFENRERRNIFYQVFIKKRVRYEALLKHFSLIAQFSVFAGKLRSIFNWINDKCRHCIAENLPRKKRFSFSVSPISKKENLVRLFVLVEAKFTDINECFDSEKID